MELGRLYAQTKSGAIDPNVAGKLAHMLGLMIATARDHDFDARIGEIERRLAGVPPTNGHDLAARPNGMGARP